MGEWIREYYEQLNTLWEKLDKKARMIIIISFVAVMIILVFLIFRGGSGGYQPLFNQLSSRDAGEIVDILDEEGISYRLTGDGSSVEVPADKIHNTRLMLAGEGLPTQGVVGFEIFDESQFGTTDYERRVNFYRALGGELSRSIRTMGPIEFARVQISPPEESIFSQEETKAEASVLLRLRTGYELSTSQVKAIRNLVASSVQKLSSDGVTVVDSAGNLLSKNIGEEDDWKSMSMNQFEIQRSFEQGLKNDLENMLSRVMGPNNFSIQIKALLNFDEREVETESFSPVVDDEGIVRSKQESREIYRDSVEGEEGVPGTTSNIPQYQESDENSEDVLYESSDITTNYEINRRIEREVYAPGELERLSVSVIVNNTVSDEVQEQLEDSIQAAVGYNSERGDQVTVSTMEFDRTVEEEIEAAMAASEDAQMRRNYLYAGLILFILILLIAGIVIMKKSVADTAEETGEEIDMVVDDETGKIYSGPDLSEEEKKRLELKEKLQEQIAEQPEEVAQLIKSWLMEE